jgi:hypothetical protein
MNQFKNNADDFYHAQAGASGLASALRWETTDCSYQKNFLVISNRDSLFSLEYEHI